MDLLYFLVALFMGFVVFVFVFYVLARWMFPKIREKDGEENYSMKKSMQARSSRKNPYSF